MLTDAIFDFTYQVKGSSADITAELATFEDNLDHYAGKEFGYGRQIFPLLRRAARWYVAGKLSWRALKAISLRVDLFYVGFEGTEESLVEDLRSYIRAKPTIDLRAKIGAIIRRRRVSSQTTSAASSAPSMKLPVRIPSTHLSAMTSTGVVLRLVR